MPCRRALPWLLLACCITGSAGAQDDDITVYRCTDAAGRLTLQDAPCARDQSQQTRRMLQLQDPPPRATPAAPVATQPPPQPQPERVIVRREPRPMYECVRPDGGRYTSDDGEGNPRWVASGGWWPYDDATPLSTPGIAYERSTATTNRVAVSGAASSARRDAGNGAPQLRFRHIPRDDPPPPTRPGHGHGHGHGGSFDYGYGYGGGMWVRDECSVLPQAETCSRLRDRREEVRRRFFNAQETERATLRTEERGINARLSEDCGGA